MKLIVRDVPGPEWDKWVSACGGNVYHSAEWGETQRSEYSRPKFFSWMSGERECAGLAMGIERWSPTPCLGRFVRQIEFGSYPVAESGGPDQIRVMIQELVEYSTRNGYRSLDLESYNTSEMVPDLERLGFVTNSRIEFVLDLSMAEEDLWTRLSPHHRRKIRKAKQAGLVFEEVKSQEGIRALRQLLRGSRDRRVDRGEKIGILDDGRFEKSVQLHIEKGIGRVFMMSLNEKPVSGVFISIYAGKVYYVYGGSSPEGFKLDAPVLLFWNVFKRCRDLNCREFNMGGVPASGAQPDSASYGLYRFKAGFQGRQVSCLSGVIEKSRPSLAGLTRMVKAAWTSS